MNFERSSCPILPQSMRSAVLEPFPECFYLISSQKIKNRTPLVTEVHSFLRQLICVNCLRVSTAGKVFLVCNLNLPRCELIPLLLGLCTLSMDSRFFPFSLVFLFVHICIYVFMCVYIRVYGCMCCLLSVFSILGQNDLKFLQSIFIGHIFWMCDHSYCCSLNCLHLLHVWLFDVLYPKL